jgi:hypothetical protein
MEDKLIKILGRYISRVYPELLRGELNFYKMLSIYPSNLETVFIGRSLMGGRYILYVGEDEYGFLVKLFGEDLFLGWFNREHYITFIDLFGEEVLGNRSFIGGITYSM